MIRKRADSLNNGAPQSEPDSDEAIVTAIAAQDEAALGLLYDRYGRVAYQLAYRIVGERNAAEDVVQDAYLSLWRNASKYRQGRGSVRTWLLAIVHYRAIDRLRGTAGRSRQNISLDEYQPQFTGADPWATVELHIQQELLQQSMATLPAAQREAIKLAYFQGYTQQEIATNSSVPVGTVKARLRLGLKKLRVLLDGTGISIYE